MTFAGSFTLLTSPTPIGKQYELVDGELKKTTLGRLSAGTYEVVNYEGIEDFIGKLQAVRCDQALMHSVTTDGSKSGPLTTKAKPKEGFLARTKENFCFPPGAGIMTLDYDPQDPTAVLSRDQLLAKLHMIIPEIVNAVTVWWCSGSSYIYNGDTELQGLKGQRLYIAVKDATDIPRAGKVIQARSWLCGLGYIKLDKRGSKLKYALFDAAMFGEARMDYIGGAVCVPPLSQRRGAPISVGGTELFDTRKFLPNLDAKDARDVELLISQEEEEHEAESQILKDEAVRTEGPLLAEKLKEKFGLTGGEALARAKHTLYAAYSGLTLTGDYTIILEDGTAITVAELLSDRDKYHECKTLDPINPEHRYREACGILFLKQGTPILFSFAHGNSTYLLAHQRVSLQFVPGHTQEIGFEVAKALVSSGTIFNTGAGIVFARPGRMQLLEPHLEYIAGGKISMYKSNKEGKKTAVDIPPGVIKAAFSAMEDDAPPPRMRALNNGPYATASGRFVLHPGFDYKSQIYNTDTVAYTLPDVVTKATCIEALKVLWKPWSDYRWASDAARAGMLSAIFTAVLSTAIGKSPGFFFDAPVQGSGKTMAAEALCWLKHGADVASYPFAKDGQSDAELKKHLFSVLRSDKRYWLIDNVVGPFRSETISTLVTSGRIEGRVLGQSVALDAEARILLCVTGNNADLDGDLLRRFVCCRIDTGVENPTDVSHSFEPKDIVEASRTQIILAVLTLLKAYWTSDRVSADGGDDYPDWKKLVREPVLWLDKSGLAVEAGIGKVLDPRKALGTFTQQKATDSSGLEQLLVGIGMACKGNAFTAASVAAWARSVPANGLDETSANSLIKQGLDSLLGPAKESTGHSSFSIGKMFTSRIDTIAGGQKIVYDGKRSNLHYYRVEVLPRHQG